VSIAAWYDVWCDEPGCGDWTPGAATRGEAAKVARKAGWRKEQDGWKCPRHTRAALASEEARNGG
jgi:hypothetical protein